MVAEFDRYLDLFEKPKIFEMLRDNREKLFFTLMQTVDNFRDQIDGSKFSKNAYVGSEVLSKLYTVGHLKSKVRLGRKLEWMFETNNNKFKAEWIK